MNKKIKTVEFEDLFETVDEMVVFKMSEIRNKKENKNTRIINLYRLLDEIDKKENVRITFDLNDNELEHKRFVEKEVNNHFIHDEIEELFSKIQKEGITFAFRDDELVIYYYTVVTMTEMKLMKDICKTFNEKIIMEYKAEY